MMFLNYTFTRYTVKKSITDFLTKHILSPFGFRLCVDCHMLMYDDKHIRCYDCHDEYIEYKMEESRQEEYEDKCYDLYDLD